MTAADRLVGWRLLRVHQWLYERTGGRWGAEMGGRRMLLLATTGRRSGLRRTVSLLFVEDGDRLVVVGSKGGSDEPPAWLVNLQANPAVDVQVGTKRFPARAFDASREERSRLWPLAVRAWPSYERYQGQTRREIPIVVLEPASPDRSPPVLHD